MTNNKEPDNSIPQSVRDIIINLFDPNIPSHVRDNHRDTLLKIIEVSNYAVMRYAETADRRRNKPTLVKSKVV